MAIIKKKKYKRVLSGILYIYAAPNNTIFSLAEENGNVLTQVTAGSCGFNNCKKSTPHASTVAAQTIMKKAKENHGIKNLIIKYHGSGLFRDMLHLLNDPEITFNYIEDLSNPPYGGCRPKKRRRV